MKMKVNIIEIMMISTCKSVAGAGEAHGLLLQPVRMSWLVEISVNSSIIVIIIVINIVIIIVIIIGGS